VKKIKSYRHVLVQRRRVEDIRTILAMRETFSSLWKYPIVVSGEASQSSNSFWLTCVVSISVIRQQMNYFFSILFSLSSTHPKLKNILTFCIILIVVLIFFIVLYLLWILFMIFFQFHHLSFYFIFMSDSVLFLLIDIYFTFHPYSNWFSFQFHTWFLFFLIWSPLFSL